jgi:hypothetical protein
MSSSIRLRWRHAVFHYFLINVYNFVNASYSYANKTSVYAGFDWYGSALKTAGFTALFGPVYFGSYYVFVSLMNLKDATATDAVVSVDGQDLLILSNN